MPGAPQRREATEAEKILRTIEDPVAFAGSWLRSRVWRKQAEIMRAIATHNRVAVKACHSSGKTFVAALAALWWLSRFRDGIVITTAPSWVQVQKLLWGEIHKAIARARIAFPAPSQTELYNRADNYIMGLSTNEGVRFQGFHGKVLIILDESPGVKQEIKEAIEGIRAGGDVRQLEIGNPIVPSGSFYDIFSKQRPGWWTDTISAFDTPNLASLKTNPDEPMEATLATLLSLSEEELDTNPVPYLTTRRWVKEKYEEWGPGHPLWASKVVGEFPTESDEQLISLAWAEAAAKRPAVDGGGELTAGVDVAGPGEDETVLTLVTETGSIIRQKWWALADARGKVVAELNEYGPADQGGRIGMVNVDVIGIGYHMATHIRDQGYQVNFVNVGESADNDRRFANRKAEYYWGLRLDFQEGRVSGLTDEKTQGQLTTILYEHDARGRVVIESKEDARKRGVKSPDRAESLMLALARRSPSFVMATATVGAEEKPKAAHAYDQQIQGAMPRVFEERPGTCGKCVNFEPRGDGKGRCSYHMWVVGAKQPQCDDGYVESPED